MDILLDGSEDLELGELQAPGMRMDPRPEDVDVRRAPARGTLHHTLEQPLRVERNLDT